MNRLFTVVLLLSLIFTCGYRRPDKFVIDAVTNAARHNLNGVDYMREHCYYAAIQEFKIAISLNPDTQSSAVYYNNLGETYIKIGYPMMAVDCFERALKLNGVNFLFYQNLVTCYKQMGVTNSMISKYKSSKNPLDKVMLGLLYVESGDKRLGIITLDDFCMSEPDLILTQGVRRYLQDISKK